jgi:hypothetical protein
MSLFAFGFGGRSRSVLSLLTLAMCSLLLHCGSDESNPKDGSHSAGKGGASGSAGSPTKTASAVCKTPVTAATCTGTGPCAGAPQCSCDGNRVECEDWSSAGQGGGGSGAVDEEVVCGPNPKRGDACTGKGYCEGTSKCVCLEGEVDCLVEADCGDSPKDGDSCSSTEPGPCKGGSPCGCISGEVVCGGIQPGEGGAAGAGGSAGGTGARTGLDNAGGVGGTL